MSSQSSSPRGERWYRLLLRLFPAPFRARYADDMLEFYRERAANAPHTLRGLISLWARLLADVIGSAVAERAAVFAGRRRPSQNQNPHQPSEETMSILRQDIRYALRGMFQRPGFTAVVLLTLALGIGANAAIFSVVNAVLLRPLPFAHVERLIDFRHQEPLSSVSEPEFIDYQHGMPALSKLAAFNGSTATIAVGEESVRTDGSRVSRDFFDILGVQPAVGRVFAADEFAPHAKGGIVVISNGLWRQQFASDPRAVGKTMQINGAPFTIVGVMPAGFNYPQPSVSFWTPWRLNPDSLWTRNNHYLSMVGRLAPGATLDQARAQAATLNKRWMHDFPETYFPAHPIAAAIVPLRDHLFGAARPYLLALLGAVAFILLIACVNVANLLLARGETRRKELAIRTALGASGHRIVRQMLTESMLLALAGALLGIGFAWIGARALVAMAPGDVPRLDEIGVDYRVIAFTIAITLVTGVLFGLVPAIRGTRGDSIDTLRDGGKTSAVGGSRAVRGSLVAAEVALAVVMLSGAGLLVRSLVKLRAIELGFTSARLLTMSISIPPKRQYTDTTGDELFRQIRERVRQLPGVESAAFEGELPISGGDSDWSIMIDGRVVKTIAEAPTGKPDQVSPDLFKTMGIRLVRGRAIAESDRMGAPPVVVVNEAMAKKWWPGVDPVDHVLKMFNPASPWVTIVGVVADVRARGFQGTVPPTMYFPYSQSATSAYYQPNTMTLVVRAVGDAPSLTPAIRAVVHSLDAHIPISDVATMDDVIGQSIASRRFTTVLLAGFAGLALALAGIGIYGVISFGVTQRTYEIGVRIALGASGGSVMRLVIREGLRMTTLGLGLGLVGAAAVDRLLRSLLVGVSTVDLPTMFGVVAVLVAVAASASALPARRASGVSPTEALRNE